MYLSSSIFSIHMQKSFIALIQPYVQTTQNGCDLDLCFKSMRCLLPSWCYRTKVSRILSCLFYSSTTVSMSTQNLSVKPVGLNRRFEHAAQRAVGWEKSLCAHGNICLACLKLLLLFCHVECWSLSLAHFSCTAVALNSPILEYNGETRQKHQLGKLTPRLTAMVI